MHMTLKRGVRIDPLWNGVEVGGKPLAHGKILAYEPDSNEPKPLWKSSDKALPWNGPHGNQVDLDAGGKALAYGHGLYQLVVCDRTFTPVQTWEPRFYGHEVVSARDFGAVGAGDDSIDRDTGALQAAVDYCVRTGAKLFVPAGVYKLTESLRVYRLMFSADGPHSAGRASGPNLDRRVFAPCQIEVMGERSAYGIQGNDTVLVATFNDRPAIVIQGASGAVLSRISVEGLNDYPLTGDPEELLDDATFVVAGCRDGNNRFPARAGNANHSPYAAVVIDPYGTGGPPADGGYPGHEDDYFRNGLASTGVTLEQCNFYRFVVACWSRPREAPGGPRGSPSATAPSSTTRSRSPSARAPAPPWCCATCDPSATSSSSARRPTATARPRPRRPASAAPR